MALDDDELRALYHGGDDAPPATLDRRLRDAARRALPAERKGLGRTLGYATAATALIAAILIVGLPDDGERAETAPEASDDAGPMRQPAAAPAPARVRAFGEITVTASKSADAASAAPCASGELSRSLTGPFAGASRDELNLCATDDGLILRARWANDTACSSTYLLGGRDPELLRTVPADGGRVAIALPDGSRLTCTDRGWQMSVDRR